MVLSRSISTISLDQSYYDKDAERDILPYNSTPKKEYLKLNKFKNKIDTLKRKYSDYFDSESESPEKKLLKKHLSLSQI
jgi:hypothetical protein